MRSARSDCCRDSDAGCDAVGLWRGSCSSAASDLPTLPSGGDAVPVDRLRLCRTPNEWFLQLTCLTANAYLAFVMVCGTSRWTRMRFSWLLRFPGGTTRARTFAARLAPT